MLVNRLLGLCLILSSVSVTFVSLNSAQAGELTRSDHCQSIGRVIHSEDVGIAPGAELCEDSQIVVSDGSQVKIGCLKGGRSRWLPGGRYDTNELCAYQRTIEAGCWFMLNIVSCNRSAHAIVLKTPRSSAVLSTPNLEWGAVEDASYYEIFVESDAGQSYRVKTDNPSAKLSSYTPWKQGDLYRIKILAATKGKILSEGKFTIRIPSTQEMQEIETTIGAIESSNFPTTDKALLVDSVYFSAGLIQESIDYLESASIATKSPEIAKVLAYRYSALEDPKNAGENYQIMADNSPEGSEDQEFAEEMLQRIVQYQARASFQ